jgi:hypothetical protein
MTKAFWGLTVIAGLALMAADARSQTLPDTPGETLSGKRIVVADAVRGHAAVLIVGFSKDAGDGCGAWARAVRADTALAGVAVYQIAMLEGAPGFVRGMIKSGMRKGVAAAEQDTFVVLVHDDKLWRNYFGVTADAEPYVALLDAKGQVLWHGHGAAKDLEPLLKGALK